MNANLLRFLNRPASEAPPPEDDPHRRDTVEMTDDQIAAALAASEAEPS
jgi:hypothetical protein